MRQKFSSSIFSSMSAIATILKLLRFSLGSYPEFNVNESRMLYKRLKYFQLSVPTSFLVSKGLSLYGLATGHNILYFSKNN